MVILMLALSSPDYLQPLYSDIRGFILDGMALTMLASGILHHEQDGSLRDMRSTRLQDFQIADWLPAGVRLDDVIVVLASLAVLAMFFAMWQALRPDTAFERRFEEIVQRKESLRQTAPCNAAQPTPARRRRD